MKKKYLVLSIITVLVAVLLVTSCGAPEQQVQVVKKSGGDGGTATETINVGFMAPLTGDAASYGLSILRGAELAVKEMNLDNVKLVTEDSMCDPKEAVSAINKLVSVNDVQAIVGEVCSGATLAAAPIAQQNGVVMISSSSTSPAISEESYVFRTIPSDALQGSFGAELAARKGYTKMAVLYGNEDYGVGFKDVLEEEFPREGGEVVATEAFERGSVDLRTQLTKIKSTEPDVIYIISNSPDSAIAALKQIKELNIVATVIGSEGLKSDDVLNDAGSAAEGLIITSVSSGSAEFVAKHKAEYGEEPGPFAAQAYDAFKAIALTIQQGATTKAQIKAVLTDVNFKGASGNINFDRNGDVSGNYEVYTVKNGAWVLS